MKKYKKLYMAVTQDKYELPIAVADSAEELARLVGVKAQTVRCGLTPSRRKKGNRKYVRIEVEE